MVLMTLRDPKRRDAMAQAFRRISVITLHFWRRGCFCGSHRPIFKGRGSASPMYLGPLTSANSIRETVSRLYVVLNYLGVDYATREKSCGTNADARYIAVVNLLVC